MRRIQIATCSLMLLGAAAAPVMAQGQGQSGGPPRDPAQMIQRTTDRLMTGITLTTAQSDSVKALNALHTTEMQQAFQTMRAGAPNDSSGRGKMVQMRDRQRGELRAVLNADQQAIFDKNVADMQKARANAGVHAG